MKIKKIVTMALLVFVVGSLIFLVVGSSGNEKGGNAESSDSNSYIAAYYIHGANCCATCNKIERLSHQTIADSFTEQIDNGKLKWETINFDEPGNEHYITDYELYSHSLVLVEFANGEQKTLEKSGTDMGFD